MASSHQQQPVTRFLVEEKHYRLDFDEATPLIRTAIEHALGTKLEGLAPGMWSAEKVADDWSSLRATVRALRTDEGTSVEVRLEHRFNTKAVTLFTLGIVLGCVIIVPLIPTIWKSTSLNNQNARDRLVEMHKIWTEIGEAVRAPQRADYRSRPARAYAPQRVDAAPNEAELARLEAAELEHQAALEAAEPALEERR